MVKNKQFKEVRDILRVQKCLESSIFYTSLSTFPKKGNLLLCVKHFMCSRLLIYKKRSDYSERYTSGSIRQLTDEPKCFGSDYNSEPA